MAKYCTNCGAEIGPKDKFCPDCGTAVDSPKARSRGPKKRATPATKSAPRAPKKKTPAATAPAAAPDTEPAPPSSPARSVPWRALGVVAASAVLALGAYLLWSWARSPRLADEAERTAGPPTEAATEGPATDAAPGDVAYLGLEFAALTPARAKALGLTAPRGVEIRSLAADGPAAKAGLKAGDVVLELGGKPVADMAAFSGLLAGLEPGAAVDLKVWRGGGEHKHRATMGAFLHDAVPKAEAGDVYAMRSLAALYFSGRLGAADPAKGVHWLRKAAQAGDTGSLYLLAVREWTGNGVIKNRGAALHRFEQAARKGHMPAMMRLGEAHFLGLAGAKDFAKSMRFYKMAAVKGNAEAMRWVGNLYRTGSGTARDMKEAARWYREAAQKGDPPAMYNLAVSYHRGQGLPQNFKEAAHWYQKAVDRNFTTALFNLAVLYHDGRGVGRDYRKAAELAAAAIEAGNEHAIRELTTNSAALSQPFRVELQRLLKQKGAYDGAIDGRFGAGTNDAIKWLAERAETRAKAASPQATAPAPGARTAARAPAATAPAPGPGKASFAGLMVETLTPALRTRYAIGDDVAGVVVTGVESGSLAAHNGLEPGMVIVDLGGEKVASPGELGGRIDATRRKGEKMVLLLVSNPQGDVRIVALPL